MNSFQMKFESAELQSQYELDHERKKLECLGCGKVMTTDRCHRFCDDCKLRLESPLRPSVKEVKIHWRQCHGRHP